MVGYQEKAGISMMGIVFRYIEDEDSLEYVNIDRKCNRSEVSYLKVAGVKDFIEQGQLSDPEEVVAKVSQSMRVESFSEEYGITGYVGDKLGYNKCVIEYEDEEQDYVHRYFYGIARLNIIEGELEISQELKDVGSGKLVDVTDELYEYIVLEYIDEIMEDMLKVINCYSYYASQYKVSDGVGYEKWVAECELRSK